MDECKERIKRERETYKFKEEIAILKLEIERLNDNALTNIELESIIFEKELEIVILQTKLTHITSLSDTILKKKI